MSQAKLIAIDWGTTSFRAYLLDDECASIAHVNSQHGIKGLSQTDFPKVLQQEIGTWLTDYPDLPVIMSGMIGSRNGWHEVPYLNSPCDLTNLAKHLFNFRHDSRLLSIVPGVQVKKSNRCDVMRGEETQLLGALHMQETLNQRGLFCIPGTHSKWISTQGMQLKNFQTYMTGELFAMLMQHSLLPSGQTLPNDLELIDEQDNVTEAYGYFQKGLLYSKEKLGLSAKLFNARASVLLGDLPEQYIAAYLSGILIGHEIRSAMKVFASKHVTLIADERLLIAYQLAAAEYGFAVDMLIAELASQQGLMSLLDN